MNRIQYKDNYSVKVYFFQRHVWARLFTLFLFDPFAPRQVFPFARFVRWFASSSFSSAAAPTSTPASPSRNFSSILLRCLCLRLGLGLRLKLGLRLAIIELTVTHPGDLVVSTDGLMAGQRSLISKFATTAIPTVTIPISIHPARSYNGIQRYYNRHGLGTTWWVSFSCVYFR